MNDNSPKQCEIESLEDIHNSIIMNEYKERKEKKIMKLNIYLLKR